MQPKAFLELLQNPQEISVRQTEEIGQLVKKYPYLQSARAIYLKGLKNNNSPNYNHQLKITAAYTTDRSILFDYIVSEEFNQNEISDSIKKNSEHLRNIEVTGFEDISVNKSVKIDDALKQQIRDTEGVLDPNLFKEKIEIGKVAKLSHDKKAKEEPVIKHFKSSYYQSPEEKLQLGKPLEFNKDETHSFAEWLKISTLKPIDRDSNVSNTHSDISKVSEVSNKSNQDKKFNLIDKFLKSNPKIVPSKNYKPKPLIYKDDISHEGIMTETLARIYLEQKNYEKAIKSYKILSLKYPEKSSFFADQIKAVKELQENNKE